MKARDVMTWDPAVVMGDDPVSAAAQLMRDADIGVVPVVWSRADMRLRGLLTDRDIAVRHVAAGHAGSCRVVDDMTVQPLTTVAPDADIMDVMRLMERQQVKRLPVTDDAGRLMGMITLADLSRRTGPDYSEEVGHVVEGISAPTDRS